jgi:hypothetical protein
MSDRNLTTSSYKAKQRDEHTSTHLTEWEPMASVVKVQSVFLSLKNATTKTVVRY